MYNWIYIYESEKINENNIIIAEINLIKDNKSSSITPSIDSYFSTYSDYYKANNLFINTDYYYCSKSNNNDEYLMFDFEKEYWFQKIVINFYDKYPENKIKSYNIMIYEQKKRIIDNFEVRDLKRSLKCHYFTLLYKFRYIKFELIENHGGNFFIIKYIVFIPDDIYSIK